MIETGKVLQNRYCVEKQIGQGGMGAVYVATDERFGSTVAIKETLFMDDKFRKAFEREARLLNSLRHTALPRVSDHFIEGNGQFLVMEYIAGEDLSEMLEHEGKVFSLNDVLNWADQLLDALEFLHTQEMPVIHRDIKPQNLKLTSRGQIILLDFGLAKGNPTNPESATAAKSVFGYSRNYASLEQIQGTGTDPRSDLYSLAATLYHLLTGVPPADALTRAMNVLSEKEDPLIAINEIRPEIPASIAEVLHKAMALNANQRPISAQAMRAMFWEAKDESVSENVRISADRPPASNLFTQKTQVLTEPDNLSNSLQSGIRTEVLSNNLSTETVPRPLIKTGDFEAQDTKTHRLAPETKSKKSRRALAVGAALGSLVLVGCAASAIYIYNPELLGAKSNSANINTEKTPNIIVVVPENTNTLEVNANTANTNIPADTANANVPGETTQKETVAKTETRQTPNKTTETSKTETKTTKTETTVGQSNSKDETVVADEPDAEEPSTPPTNPKTGKQIPPFVWRGMTPKQRRQLRQALELERKQKEQQRRQQEQQRRNPRPPPTPY